MGRVKLKIKRLENSNGRQTTYAKRKNGILKKANELSILCDIDIILLMFSPTGKPSLCCGKKSIEEVIAKFAQLTPQERAKRKLESLEALKKTFKKLDHDVNIQDFMGSTQTAEDLAEQARQLKDELAETEQRLSYWMDPEKIDSLEHLGQMEDSLGKSLDVIHSRKENLEKQHTIILQETAAQIQSEMPIPYRLSLEDHYQPLPWNPNDNAHIPFAEDPSFSRPREMECSASSSFATYSSYLGLGKGSQADAFRDDAGFLSELGRSSPLGHLVSGHYSFPSYSNNLLATDSKYPISADMNIQNTAHLEAQTSYGTPQPVLDNNHVSWASTSAPFAETIHHGSWASNCVPFADTMQQIHGGWTSTSGPCAATTTNGSWASTSGPYPVALFDEHYQVSFNPFSVNKDN